MTFMNTIIEHSPEFIQILKDENNPRLAIKGITHTKPVLVFWISPSGRIVDAVNSHHKNPPEGDKTILVDRYHRGYIRGRSAMIGQKLYAVIYGDGRDSAISDKQLFALCQYHQNLISYLIVERKVDETIANQLIFINEWGLTISCR